MNLNGRINALERPRQASEERCRVIIRGVAHTANLANSTCTRKRYADGQLTEIVDLDGSLDDLGENELEEFIASFPIEEANPCI